MTRIAILAQTIADGDAVGNDVCGMAKALTARGHDVRIYGEGGNTGQTIWPASEVTAFLKGASDVAIYHHSIGWIAGAELLGELRNRKTVIKYHNVTPPEFFAGISTDFESRCKLGREQLAGIAGGGHDLYLADSLFNLKELATPVRKNSFVVPPFHHTDELLSVEPHLGTLDLGKNGKANIVMVGRVSPNKGHAELIEDFATYYYDYNRHAQLLIIGHLEDAFKTYYQSLDDLISSFCLEGAVVFTGAVSLDVLKAYYLTAHLMLVTSRHEGFCVPLIEAMAMKIPIVAYSHAAIPETVDDVALLWDEHNPRLVAESINAIVTNEDVTASLVLKGAGRYQQFFSNVRVEQRFIDAMSTVLDAS